jgi:hypothetical protein
MHCDDAHPRLAALYTRLLALQRRGPGRLAQPTVDDDWLEVAEELQPLWQEHEHCWSAEVGSRLGEAMPRGE